MAFTCRTCGETFDTRAELTRHQNDERKQLQHLQHDDPTLTDDEAFADMSTATAAATKEAVPDEAAANHPATQPATPVVATPVEKPAEKPQAEGKAKDDAQADSKEFVIPWTAHGVDPFLKCLISKTPFPVRFVGQAFAREDGLHVFSLTTGRR